jgi:hypothetical protein
MGIVVLTPNAPRHVDDHPTWSSIILPLLVVNGRRPRKRIECRDPGSVYTRRLLLDVLVQCVRCGQPIHPIRMRRERRRVASSMHFTVSCEQVDRQDCSRSPEASYEKERILRLISGWKDPDQASMF